MSLDYVRLCEALLDDEQLIPKPKVTGSSPVGTANEFNSLRANAKILSNCLATDSMGPYGYGSGLGKSLPRQSARAAPPFFLSVSLFGLRTVSPFSNRRHERKRFLSC